MWQVAARVFGQLCRTLAERGEVVIRVADLAGRDGLTDFRRGIIYVDHALTLAAARAAICHELVHLRRGPVPAHRAVHEEHEVRRETARTLAPDVAPLRRIPRAWTRAELAALAADEACVDTATICDAATLRTGAIPVQRPAEGVA